MGIQGLLPLLKSIHKPCNLKKFSGQTLGVDAYGWLHRGVVACAIDLALDKPCTKWLDYALHRVRMLVHFGVTPYLVFDGDNLPSKASTEASRRERREEARREGLELYHSGKTAQAHKVLQKAIDVTPTMAWELIEELKKINVPYVVAPYEADAQLAYLERRGIINGVLSEDSDLLVFGVKRLLTKLDQYGNCVEVNRNEFASCKDISLIGWTDADFRRMAILSGCDYLKSIPKMGIMTAYRMVRRHKDIGKILRMVQFDGTILPVDYATNFEQAERSFLHHRVFCPVAKELVFLNDLPHGVMEEDMPYLGIKVDPETAILLAFGELDPITKKSMLGRKTLRPSKTAFSARVSSFDENRRHTFATTEDLKSNKKINSFFKKRMPLAELDPNSLTPSPTQQILLQRHANTSWEATSSPSPAIGSVRSASVQRSLGIEVAIDAVARAAKISDYKPPKRQRLCSENEEESVAADTTKSPFFSTPSRPRTSKVKKAKRSNFGIYSDDSVEDALIKLSGSTEEEEQKIREAAGLRSEVAGECVPCSDVLGPEDAPDVDEDVTVVPASSPLGPVEEECQSEMLPHASMTSRSTSNVTSQSTAATSFSAEDGNEPFVDLIDYHERNVQRILLQSFSYHSSAAPPQDPEERKEDQTKEDMIQLGIAALAPPAPSLRDPKVDEETEMRNVDPRIIPVADESLAEGMVRGPLTASQLSTNEANKDQSRDERVRLGLAALTPSVHQLGQHVLRKTKSMRAMTCRPDEEPGYESDNGVAGAHTKKNVAKWKGSEDLIVPNSEDEEDDLLEEDELPPMPPKVDLGQFAFKGRG